QLPGVFVAWLSTSTVSARSRIAPARGFIRTDGRPFGDALAAIDDGAAIFYPLRLDERGRDLVEDGHVFVMTALDPSGSYTAGDATCTSGCWNDGFPRQDPSQPAHLYCFGTDRAQSLSIDRAAGRLAFLTTGSFMPGMMDFDELCRSEAAAYGKVGNFVA